MKKNIVLVLIVLFILFSLSFVLALTLNQFFFDGLETANFATIWTNDINNKFTRDTGLVYVGTNAILGDGGVANALLTLTTGLNVSSQTTCNLTSVIRISNNFDANEYLCMDYSLDGGTSWNLNTGSDGVAGGLCQDGNLDIENAWRNITYSFSASGINSFKLRFRINSNNANEDGYIDNINLTCLSDNLPVIVNVTSSHSLIKGGSTLTIYANTTDHGVNDTEQGTLYFYCDNSTTPNSTNTDCTGGVVSDVDYPYVLSCNFATPLLNQNITEFCRVYDAQGYSSVVNISYRIDSTAPTTSVLSVAGDSIASYYDIINDGRTNISILGESNMVCRWSSSDVSYSSMSNDCLVGGNEANCSISDVVSQGFITRYISCADSLGNEQNSSDNLNVQFYLDYTPPTTTDNAAASAQVPNYTITLTELDNTDSDPTSYYCTSSIAACSPTISINNGGNIIYTTLNRGINYLRYYSIDDAGNNQTVVNKTVNINQLPLFTSAVDNALTIKGGAIVNVSVVSEDLDSNQDLVLYVCPSLGATSSGCSSGHYCNATSTANMSCVFTSELDSATHNWYAYIFDDLGEPAETNPLTGSYVTDYTSPIITLISPLNNSIISQNSITVSITVSESLGGAWYSLDSGVNNVSMSNSSLLAYSHSNLSIANGNYNLSIWVNDSVGNNANSLGWNFIIDSTANDTLAPQIVIWSPINGTYDLDGEILINISSDEALSWAGYQLNSGVLTNLDNYSVNNWNVTLSGLSDGRYNLTIFANDSSSNKNQANVSLVTFVDLINPKIDSFSCNDANDSEEINCSANVSDSIGLNYAFIGYNASGVWQNSTHISLSGTRGVLSYIINAGNTTPPGFSAQIFLVDLAGRNNFTQTDFVLIRDNTFPLIYNITYSPNDTNLLDPGVNVSINVSVIEDYIFGDVYLMYKNSSVSSWTFINMTNASVRAVNTSVIFNVTLLGLNSETWSFKINVTDAAGNQNISLISNFVVEYENSFVNTTDIDSVETIGVLQRSGNNSLGRLFINNTGDYTINFTVNISSPLSFDVNYTGDMNATYQLLAGESINLTILANTTGLNSATYKYNLSIFSIIDNSTFVNNLVIGDGPYLEVIITGDNNVAKEDLGIFYSATVTNYGNQEAEDIYLNWSLPSEFTLVSGNLSRYFSSLAFGGAGRSGTNTITVNVASTSSNNNISLGADVSSSNVNSASSVLSITLTDKIGTVVTTTIGSPTGGGGGGGGSVAIKEVTSETIDVVRGDEMSFDVVVKNKQMNKTLRDLTLSVTGYPAQYIEIIQPAKSSLNYGEETSFRVKIKVPTYKSYEELNIQAIISGNYYDFWGAKQTYSETQKIKLVIQEVSREKSLETLGEAEKAILEMQNAGFNIDEVQKLLIQARQRLAEDNNKDTYDLANQIIEIKNKAESVYTRIMDLKNKLIDPNYNPDDKSNLVTGIINSDYFNSSTGVLTGRAIFVSSAIQDLISMAEAAFNRGDYSTADERISKAELLLSLERKGNVFLFLYLYWHFVLIGCLLLALGGVFSYKQYQKYSISRRIQDIDGEENSIRAQILASQKSYFLGKISGGEYHRIMAQYQNKLAKIKKERLTLRNKRIRTLSGQRVLRDLGIERTQVENEVKKLQEQFYRDKKISENEYETEFKILNERLAEIEGEKITLEMLKQGKVHTKIITKDENKLLEQKVAEAKDNESWKIKLFFQVIAEVVKAPFHYIKNVIENHRLGSEDKIKEKIKKMLGEKNEK